MAERASSAPVSFVWRLGDFSKDRPIAADGGHAANRGTSSTGVQYSQYQMETLCGLTFEEIQARLEPRPDARLRAKQLAEWIYRRATDRIDAIHVLPQALRGELREKFSLAPLEIASHQHSSDGVDKLLVHSGDNQVFECVLLPYPDRVSCCLSSQVGCPMGCTFCATGLGGYERNLSVSEIVAQYLSLQRISDRRISHIVMMGMGEPLLNIDSVIRSFRIFHDEVGLSYRHMTISTVGLAPQVRELGQFRLPIHLALSLHSPFDEVRSKLMPVNRRWPVAEIMDAMREYQQKTGRKITIEYLLIDRLNDTEDQAVALAELVKGLPSFVNLIPFNYVNTQHDYRRPDPQRVRAFRRVLEQMGVNVTQRVERGHDIAAACGQLAGQHQGRFARRTNVSMVPIAP